MSPSGRKTASAVTPMTPVRARLTRIRALGVSLAALDRRLPLLDEFQTPGLIEVTEQFGTDRDRLGLVAEGLGNAGLGHLALDIGADRTELGLVGDDRLTAPGKDVVEPQLGCVGGLRRL